MPFRCPQCHSPASLEIARSIELPPDSRSDEITLQVVECSGCGLRAIAVYEESRRGRLDSECWEHSGYQVSFAALERLDRLIDACPDPHNPRCVCPSHRILAGADERRSPYGRWRGLEELEIIAFFPMETA